MNRHRRIGLGIAVALLVSGCTPAAATPTVGGLMTPTDGATPTGEAPATSPTPGATPRAAQWVSAGTMNTARAATHAVLLSTGDVLVVGEDAACEGEGMYGGSKSVFAEVYHPSSNTWATTGSLNAPRAYFASAALTNGRALVTAGVNGDGVSYSSTKIYDVATGTFTESGLLNYARTSPAYARLNDGRVLVAGGTFYNGSNPAVRLSSAEIFDPVSATWSMTGAMLQARDEFQAVTLTDGRVLAVGSRLNTVTTAELWDPSTGTWSNAGSLANNRWALSLSLVALPDGSALVAGGRGAADALASAERFDPASLTWSSAGNMQIAAAGRMAAVLANGKVLFAGGWVSSQNYATASEIYDPATGSWTPTVPLPHMRADGQTVLLADGSVLIAGGDDDAVRGGAVGGGDCRRGLPEALRYIPATP